MLSLLSGPSHRKAGKSLSLKFLSMTEVYEFRNEFLMSIDEAVGQLKSLRGLKEDEYIGVILSQQGVIREQQDYIKELENVLRKHDNPHTPSSKKRKEKTDRNREKEETEEKKEEKTEEEKVAETEDEGERFPGKSKGSNGGGISIPDPDDVNHHTLDEDGLEEVDTRKKTVIDLPEKPIQVVKHVIHIYENEQGEKMEPEADLPKGVYGEQFQAFVTLLRGTCGASHEKIAEIVQGIRPDLSFSPTTSLNIPDNMARQLKGERERIWLSLIKE
ncbi:hypothetical protein AKJ52_00015 [candidate division MSBL1 archaeon SCGC-AAA382C18]|uniref:Uncharacterized protein n=1 Tax=candidate division MSBL1 archaeon SCGC-AAA382C18 TaxID=1698281 RepID=A0A133VM37_9EURY|nr:hypothetical protein AKJ52_00015 [candidate division MSBL1 archaeon SCGC-AAA382C18]